MVHSPKRRRDAGQISQQPKFQSPLHEVDYVLVGAGMSGVFMLAEALQQGFKSVVVIDRKDRIGGLWADLPAWQTIQNRPSDFTMQGFTTDKKVWYAKDVLHMLDEYVRVQSLEPYIRLNTDVVAHEWSQEEDRWLLTTRDAGDGLANEVKGEAMANTVTYRCKVLILCTGRHARPIFPHIPTDGSVPMLHSSQVHNWHHFKGKRVAVLGGGASSLDLLINTLRVNEDRPDVRVSWVLREPKYFTGGESDADLFKLTLTQLLSPSGVEVVSLVQWAFDWLYRFRFWRAGIADWLPRKRMDIHSKQVIPDRAYLLEKANHQRVDRHCGTEISEIRDGYLHLSNGQVLGPFDHLLLGTGYERPKHPPGTSELLEAVRDKLLFKALVPGRHLGRLILAGEEFLESSSAVPYLLHFLARSCWTLLRAEEQGKSATDGFGQFHDKPEDYVIHTPMVNNLHFLIFAAFRNVRPDLFTPILWRLGLLATHLYFRVRYNTTCFFADRMLGERMSLDGADGPPDKVKSTNKNVIRR